MRSPSAITEAALDGQTVAILGGSAGIGLAVARATVGVGGRAFLLGRDPAKLTQAVAELGLTAHAQSCDMRDASSVRAALVDVARIDHLVATAATDESAQRAPFGEISLDQLEHSLDKLRGYIVTVQAVVARMPPDGSITLFSGASAFRPPREGMAVLAAANAAIAGLGRALARELAPIRVNIIVPGVVDTGVWGDADDPRRRDLSKWAEAALPARRMGQPEDIAAMVLLSITNPFMTGSVLVADGGLLGAT